MSYWRRPASEKFRKNYENAGGNNQSIGKPEPIKWEDGCPFEEIPQISAKTIESFKERGFEKLMPIQCNTFDTIYNGENVIARDLTGSGKTLAFALPLVESFREKGYFKGSGNRKLLAIILAPTRELAVQVTNELNKIKHSAHEYNCITVYGGVPIYEQTKQLRGGVEFFVGTTGRVKDHIERRNIDFRHLKAVVLDEADQMLQLGFQEDVDIIMKEIQDSRKIKEDEEVKVSEFPQVCLFSATIPGWIKGVAQKHMASGFKFYDMIKDLKNKTSQTVAHMAINCPFYNRTNTLADLILCYKGLNGKAIVFTQTKADANAVILAENMKHEVEVLHGDIAQNQREVTLKRFRENKFKVLVATDVAARGLDIPNVDLVIQLDPPKEVETYIHRSGRTARAGASGTCITFYTTKSQFALDQIERKAGIKFKKISAPQPEDIIKASGKGVIEALDKVNEDVLPHFAETAEKLISSKGAEKAVQLALAYISGNTEKITKRSMLTAQEGFVTFEIVTEEEIYGAGDIWQIIRKLLPEGIHNTIRGMRLLANRLGAVFDISEKHAERVEECYEKAQEHNSVRGYTFQICKNLPALMENDSRSGGGNDWGRQGGGRDRSYGRRDNYGGGGYGGRGGGDRGYGGGRNDYRQDDRSYGGRSRGGDYQRGGDDRGNGGFISRDDMGKARGSTPRRGGKSDSVFFAGASYQAKESDIEDFLKDNGLRSTRIKLLTDDQGNSKGCGFIDFEDPSDLDRAMGLSGKRLLGRPIKIKEGNSR